AGADGEFERGAASGESGEALGGAGEQRRVEHAAARGVVGTGRRLVPDVLLYHVASSSGDLRMNVHLCFQFFPTAPCIAVTGRCIMRPARGDGDKSDQRLSSSARTSSRPRRVMR